jgi:cell division septation protein DedD
VTDLLHDAADDGFHEIQLSGKQLIFLFVMTTAVSVVIFLCGVLVGRGVRAEALSASTGNTPAVSSAVASNTASAVPDPPTRTDPPAPTAKTELTYPNRLESPNPPADDLKAEAQKSTKATKATEPAKAPESKADTKSHSVPSPVAEDAPPPPAPAPAETVKAPAPAPTTGAQPGVWAVQVAALSDRSAASAVVQRLTGKGYSAFLVNPAPGAPVQSYKVQVGRFSDRSEAERVASRLQKEEQFKPWILR